MKSQYHRINQACLLLLQQIRKFPGMKTAFLHQLQGLLIVRRSCNR